MDPERDIPACERCGCHEDCEYEYEPKPPPKPIGKCPKCGTAVYSVEGFCGVCEPWKR